MTDKQPEALKVADWLEIHSNGPADNKRWAAALLRTQHAEIERLNSCLKWEQNRAERIGTHGPGCEKWGPSHFECALRAIERKDALLRQALAVLGASWPDEDYEDRYTEAVLAITKELSQ